MRTATDGRHLMNQDAAAVSTCPTCGFPTQVYLLADPEVCCPHCRAAWRRAEVEVPAESREAKKARRIEDLL